jgi:hypothetical protein
MFFAGLGAVALAVSYHFPVTAGVTICAATALWLFYIQVLCIKPSRFPRKSSLTDAPMRAKTYPPAFPNGW